MSEVETRKESGSKKTGLGMEQNLESLLCYVAGWITGIVFLILEKEDKVVRFHAMQSIVVFGAITIVSIVLGWIPILGWILAVALSIVSFILWIMLMLRAYQGKMWKVPFAGNFAEKYV